jgi:hypothetical protein
MITATERKSIVNSSIYLGFYPTFLRDVTRYDREHGAWMPPGQYRFLWDDEIYATRKTHGIEKRNVGLVASII